MPFTIAMKSSGTALAICLVLQTANAVELEATGSGNTYDLINSVLAPDGNAVEVPDCGHRVFGPHITQLFDRTLNRPVFRFHIHRDHDDDRCRNSDRQRTEIKIYARSPDALRAKPGDIFTYRWKFKLDATFQPSRRFTHLHQIKAVGGPESNMPLVTLSARKGRDGEPDQFELRHAEHEESRILRSVALQPFRGHWTAVEERIAYGEQGKYSVRITSVATGQTILSYSNDSIRMWRNGAEFIRPKWGIYRSLKDKESLKDEVVDFADFGISF